MVFEKVIEELRKSLRVDTQRFAKSGQETHTICERTACGIVRQGFIGDDILKTVFT